MSFQPAQSDENYATSADGGAGEGERGFGKKVLVGGAGAGAALFAYKRYKRHKQKHSGHRGIEDAGEEEEVVELPDGRVISAHEFDQNPQAYQS